MSETVIVVENITPQVSITLSNDAGPQGTPGNTGVVNVTAPITNSGTTTAATIGINQSALSIANTQVTGLGTASTKNIPSSGNASATEVVYGTDTRLTDSRTPTSHASSHASAGSDPVTLAQSQVTNLTTDLAAKVANTRSISTTSPINGGGDLSANRTISIDDASTTAKGAVQLTDSTSSTSTTTAATPNSVKSAYDLANTANTTANSASTTANAAAPKTTTISTTAPLSGGGDLSANRTLSIADASTTVKGAVQLTDSTASTSTTTAATPNSVKTAYDLANGKPSLSTSNPVALGTAAAGTGTAASKNDHVHPTTGLVTTASLGSGVETFLTTPSSANLASAVTDETGTGSLVFGTGPTISQPLIDNPKYGYTTTATAGGTTTLTASSNNQQFFTGTLNQTVVLPVVSTLVLGLRYKIVNNSTGTITVQSSGLNTITTIAAGNFGMFTVIATTGTGTSSWYADQSAAAASSVAVGNITGLGTGVATFLATPSSANLISAVTDETGTGALVFGTSPTIGTPVLTLATTSNTATGRIAWDTTNFQLDVGDGTTVRTITADNAAATLTNKTLTFPVIDNIKIGYTTTVTSASAVTLTATSGHKQYFTGSTAQTVILPVTSTLALGVAYEINNNSTATITVQSSGLNNIATIPAGLGAMFTVILTTGTTAASWDFEYSGFNTITGTGSAVLSASPTFTGTVTTPISSITSYQKYAVGAVTTPITANSYTVLDTDTYVIFNRNTAISVTMPTASSYTGRMLHFKTINTGAVTSAASNIVPAAGGAAAATLFSANTAGKFTILVSDGTNWIIMGQN